MTTDLHAEGDGQWLFPYPPPDEAIPLGEPRVYFPEARDLVIITFGNGAHMSLRAAKRLRDQEGLRVRVVDLRWLAPLNVEAIAEHAREVGRVLVVDEGRRSGGISEAIFTAIIEGCDRPIKMRRVVGEDTYIPLGPAADTVLPTVDAIIAAARAL